MTKETSSIHRAPYVSRKMVAARALAAFTLADIQDAPRLTKKAAKLKLLKLHRKPCVNHNFGQWGTGSSCLRCGFRRAKEGKQPPKPMVGGSLAALDAKLALVN